MNCVGGAADFQRHFVVSRETFARLEVFADLLRTWNKKINLIGKTTTSDLWSRHFLDSAQLFPHFSKETKHLVDIGSGAGFPGLVLGILAKSQLLDFRVTLVEADARKSTFLRTVIRELDLDATVLNARIEAVDPLGADVVTARALAPLVRLLSYAERHLAPGGTALFMKGENYQTEIDEVLATWRFSREEVPSLTAEGAVILKIGAIERA